MLLEHLLSEATQLADAEGSPPPAVMDTIRFLHDRGVWFQLTRNPVVRSCREAAHNRRRLGTTGIPLQDELKSFLASFSTADGGKRIALLHCRADQELDMEAVNCTLGSSAGVARLSTEEAADFGIQYGTVHPFRSTDPRSGMSLQQVFDPSVLHKGDPPYTMMTNAGSLTWGIEFRPSQLVSSLERDGAMVRTITTRPSTARQAAMPAIGIITGNGPDSGMALWTLLNDAVRDRLGDRFQGDLSYPPVYIRSLPAMGLSMELNHRDEQLWEVIEHEIEDLCRDGARILALACNTTQYFGPRVAAIASSHGAEFVSISDCTIRHLEAIGAEEFAMIGIRFVADLGPWSAFRELSQRRVEPVSDAALEQLHRLAYRVKREGLSNGAQQQLGDILRRHVHSKYVVVALTELSLLLAAQKRPGRLDKVLIDTLGLYAEALADAWLRRAFPGEPP